MRSASHFSPIVLAGVMTVLAGCSTTQQTAARLRVNDARIRASELPTRARGRNPSVEVTEVSLVDGPAGSAIIVRLLNAAPTPVSDLRISVGVIYRHRLLYLNGAAGIDYFQTHLPAISGREKLTWVFSTPRRLAVAGRPFAVIGRSDAPPLSIPRRLPDLVARPRGLAALRGGELQVSVQNRSSVPQYQLPVYATASIDGHYVAAGEGTIGELDGGGVTNVQVRLTGAAEGAAISIQAPPTIFS